VAVIDQVVEDRYAIYHGDCLEVSRAFGDATIGFSVYSPPFAGLYQYSSDPRDLSNSRNYEEFFQHYDFVVAEIARITMPGRLTAVHCMDVPSGNTGLDVLRDFPGDIIRQHARYGLKYTARYHVWKEPLGVRNRTMRKSLSHRSIVEDSSRCSAAFADYLLMFRKDGINPQPITHPTGLTDYAGSQLPPTDVLHYRGWNGNQIENKYSQWVWRQYASAFWYDVRLDRVLPYREAKVEEDEKHIHPLQLDVIDRAIVLWSNPGDIVWTPFMGVGSEVYCAVQLGRRGIGAELKASYYRQAVKNLSEAKPIVEQFGLGFSEQSA
jgi:hypothetical protein